MYKLELIKPEGIKRERETKTFGIYTLAPLERGYGTTLGNSLRRILLSSIKGASIFAVRIDGVSHEFGSIEGIFEDIPLIILNLKKVRVKYTGESPYMSMPLSFQGQGEVQAKHFRPPPEIEVQNIDQKIATLTSKTAKFAMEAWVASGRGYLPVEELKSIVIDKRLFPHDVIFIDADFSPVRMANFIVENIRVEHRTDYEKLILEIETDGSISPFNALLEANSILIEHLKSISLSSISDIQISPDMLLTDEEKNKFRDTLLKSIDFLELSNRSKKSLKNAGIWTVADLLSLSEKELKKIKNFGDRSFEEVIEKLKGFNLSLNTRVFDFITNEELHEAQEKIKEAR